MNKRQQRLERIRAIERELFAAQFAGTTLTNHLKHDSGLLVRQQFAPADVERWIKNLEGTYTIRVYAEFEATLRDLWLNCFGRDTTPPMRDFIDAVGTRRYVPADVIDGTHRVRRYRNGMVHEGDDETMVVAMRQTQHYLCTFLSYIPMKW